MYLTKVVVLALALAAANSATAAERPASVDSRPSSNSTQRHDTQEENRPRMMAHALKFALMWCVNNRPAGQTLSDCIASEDTSL